MRAITLLYHDVVERSRRDTSGFVGAAAASYKVEPELFEAHLAAIAEVVQAGPLTIADFPGGPGDPRPVLLTFDDGGSSCYTHIAKSLEARGWSGHFFITADCIGRPGFLSANQIAELSNRGHVVGTHTQSHPRRMASLGWADLCREWSESVEILGDILGRDIAVGSVAGGHYSALVGRAAAFAGLRFLFNSEPSTTCRLEEGCLVLGRYTMRPRTTPRTAARICAGNILPRLTRWAGWQAKKGIKSVAGDAYLQLRGFVLNEGSRGVSAERGPRGWGP